MNSNIQPIVPTPEPNTDAPKPNAQTAHVTFRIYPLRVPTMTQTSPRQHEDALPTGPVRQDLIRRVRKLIQDNRYDSVERIDAATRAMIQRI